MDLQIFKKIWHIDYSNYKKMFQYIKNGGHWHFFRGKLN